MNESLMLTTLTSLPLIGAMILFAIPGLSAQIARRVAIGFSLATLGYTLFLSAGFNPAKEGPQFVERWWWIKSLGVEYNLGADGLTVLMLLLTAAIVPMGLLASGGITQKARLYFALILVLEAGLFGTFTALNFFHWFLYWELSLIPAFFLARLWGGPDRARASTQFFIYTMVGSVTLLLAFLAIFVATGSFDFIELARMGRSGTLASALNSKVGWIHPNALGLVVFLGAFLGFAVKVPLVPFHTWLPPLYSEAPIGTTMLLTGLMSKMGVYGFLRILLPIFPNEMRLLSTPLLTLVIITIVSSAAAALAQKDLRRILAYSSINHLGYCLLGICAVARAGSTALNPRLEGTAALNGVLLQIFNHGLTAATLFWFVGLLEVRSGGQRSINDFGGIRKVAPVFCGLMGIALFSSLGLPGLNGFVGEFLIFKGVFPLATCAAVLSTAGLLLTALFILLILQKVFNGPLNQTWATLPDLTVRERLALAPALVLMLVLGIYPQLLVGLINPTMTRVVASLGL